MFSVRPIGFVRSPFVEKAQAPRQGTAPDGAAGRIEILAEYEHALADVDGFDRLWLLFWFHLSEGAVSNKVLPPRSDTKRGLFATRSPHRPNPIGMTAVRLDRVEGLVLHVRDLDLLDGTPVIDLKPYIPYADAFPEARAGWLEAAADPKPAWDVRFTELAEAQIAWTEVRGIADLRARIASTMALGPQPHPYRRIKGAVLAVKDWRAVFTTDARTITIERIATGYRDKDLATGKDAAHELHRAFAAEFGDAARLT